MIKIEAATLEEAYKNAADSLECSVTELKIEIAQVPTKGLFGFFKKRAIIVAIREIKNPNISKKTKIKDKNEPSNQESAKKQTVKSKGSSKRSQEAKKSKAKEKIKKESTLPKQTHSIINDTIMPASFVSTQDDEDEYGELSDYLADYEEESDYCEENPVGKSICDIVDNVRIEINELFNLTCFKIKTIEVSAYNEDTLLIEFKGDDAALLIGKEGYRYKALSYMIFNWINTKYQVQLRLEIAEFLKNQEEVISKYLKSVCENIDKDGRAQTKILDGVLIQIALNELREKYPNKYIVIRSTRDGLKYIIVNDYHSK